MRVARRAAPQARDAAAHDDRADEAGRGGGGALRERSALTPWDRGDGGSGDEAGASGIAAAAAPKPTARPLPTTPAARTTTRKQKKTRTKRPRKRLLVCTSYSAGPVCRAVADAAPGWRFSDSKNDIPRADVIWCGTDKDLDAFEPAAKRRARLSKIHGSRDVCKKVPFARQLNLSKRLFPKDFAFWPTTYQLPEHRAQLEQALHQPSSKTSQKRRTFILKPDDASQGDGIFLVQKPRDLRRLDTSKSLVAQGYVADPMLLDGYKFDLRLYVLVTSVAPLRAHLCREGLVRLATTPYVAPTSKNLAKATMHLTNYSLNKRSKDFDHGSADADGRSGLGLDQGSKRAMSATLATLARSGALRDPDGTWDAITHLVRRTLVSMQPALDGGRDGQCFQIFGFDVLLNADGAPTLLEVNGSPSMCIDAVHPLDDGAAGNQTVLTAAAAVVDTKQGGGGGGGESKMSHQGGRAGARAAPATAGVSRVSHVHRQRGGVACRCMDSHEPHVHHESPVDVWIKSIVVRGALQLMLPAADAGASSARAEDGGAAACESKCKDAASPDPGALDTHTPFYDVVLDGTAEAEEMDDAFLLSRIGDTFARLVGSRNKFNSYKWRKFVTALHRLLRGSDDTSGCREAVREAEEAYRRSMRQSTESTPGVAQFTDLVVAWAAKHLDASAGDGGLGTALAEVCRGVELMP